MSGLPPTPLTPQPPRLVVVVVIQLLSRVRLFETPQAAACQASLSFTITQSLLKLMSIESEMPSKHLVLCHPLLLLPSVFPRVFAMSWLFAHVVGHQFFPRRTKASLLGLDPSSQVGSSSP